MENNTIKRFFKKIKHVLKNKEYCDSMTASYKIKCRHICSIPNKNLTKKQTSKSFFMFNKFYSKLCFNPHLNIFRFGYYFNFFYV